MWEGLVATVAAHTYIEEEREREREIKDQTPHPIHMNNHYLCLWLL